MAVQEDEKKVVGGLMRLGGTRALANHADDAPFESRTADYVNGINRELRDAQQKGEYGRYVGTAVRGVGGSVGRALGEIYEGGLNHTVFPAAEGIGKTYDALAGGLRGFGQGLFGASGENKQPEPAATGNQAQQEGRQVAKQLGSPREGAVDKANRAGGLVAGQAAAGGSVAATKEAGRERSFGLSVLPSAGDGGLNGQMPDFGRRSAGGGFVGSFDAPDDRMRRRLLEAALTPHKGAQNGQLTANQLNVARGLYEGEQRNLLDEQRSREQLAAQAAANEANHVNALQREWLQQQGGLKRDALNQAAAQQSEAAKLAESARQFDVRSAADARKNELDVAKAEREQSLLGRMDALRERLLNAQEDEEKSEIARQLAILGGQGEPKVGGLNKDMLFKLDMPTTDKDGLATTRPMIYDAQRERFLEMPDPNQPTQAQVNMLLANQSDDAKKQFDAMFGKGAADMYLKGGK